MNRPRRSVLLTGAVGLAAPLLLGSCIFPSPSPGPNAALRAVASVTSTNAYAVGNFQDANGHHDLMEHWNGKSWQEVFLPPPFGTGLTAITAVNASNLWAISETRTLHFTGLAWRSLPSPSGIAMEGLASASDGAVYGYGHNSSFKNFLFLMTAGGWRQVAALPTTPTSPGTCASGATDLSVVKANDVWISGDGNQCVGVLHWNGTSWGSSPVPAVTGMPLLNAVSAVSDTDVWAVGERQTAEMPSGRVNDNSVIIHWNGTKWTTVPTVDNRGGGILEDVDATPAGVWAVGTAPQFGGFTQDGLIKKWNGTSMVDQPVQQLPVGGSDIQDSGFFAGVSVRDGAVTSVGFYSPKFGINATLTDRRNAG